jgi:hypothetical protein
MCGCYPLCPDRLAYPEVFSGPHIYRTVKQLKTALKAFTRKPESVRQWRRDGGPEALKLQRFTFEALQPRYRQLLRMDVP